MINLKMGVKPRKKETRITIYTETAVEYFEVVDNIFDFYGLDGDKFNKHIEKLYKDVKYTALIDHIDDKTMALIITLYGVNDYSLNQLIDFINDNNFNNIAEFNYN
jgi:hypothetical protein